MFTVKLQQQLQHTLNLNFYFSFPFLFESPSPNTFARDARGLVKLEF